MEAVASHDAAGPGTCLEEPEGAGLRARARARARASEREREWGREVVASRLWIEGRESAG